MGNDFVNNQHFLDNINIAYKNGISEGMEAHKQKILAELKAQRDILKYMGEDQIYIDGFEFAINVVDKYVS